MINLSSALISTKVRKATAFSLSFLLALGNIVNPCLAAEVLNPQNSRSTLSPETLSHIDLPPDLGLIQETFIGTSKQVMIYIQDAHSIYEAQKSVQNIICFFQQNYGLNTVMVEGGEGRLDPFLFRMYPRPQILKEVFDQYLKNGELSGVVAAAVLNEKESQFYGVDDKALYEKGVLHFLEAQKVKDVFLSQIDGIQNKLEKAKKEIYPPKLLELDSVIKSFWVNKKDLMPLLQKMARIKAPTGHPHIEALIKETQAELPSKEIQKRIDTLEAGLKKSLNKDGLKSLNQKMQAFRTSQIGQKELAHELLQLARTQVAGTLNDETLERFSRNYPLLFQMQGPVFFDELQVYISEVKASLFPNDEARLLDDLDLRLALLGRLARLELSREDWDRLVAEKEKYDNWVFQGFLDLRKAQSISINEVQVSTVQDKDKKSFPSEPAIFFYETALKREKEFMRNIQSRLAAEKTHVGLFLSGGFHRQSMRDAFKKAGMSYIVVAPRITHVPGDDIYLKIMQGDVSWKSYLQPENGKVNLYKAFSNATTEKLMDQPFGDDRGRVAKEWRDSILLNLAARGQVEKGSDYTQFLDQAAGTWLEGSEKSALQADWTVRLSRLVDGLNRLVKKNEVSEKNLSNVLQGMVSMPALNVPLIDTSTSATIVGLSGTEAQIETLNADGARAELRAEILPDLDDEQKRIFGILSELTDVGTAGTHSPDYFETHTRPMIRGTIRVAKKFTRIGLDKEGKLNIVEIGPNASPIDQELMDRLSALNKNKTISDFLAQNKEPLSNLGIYLLEHDTQNRSGIHSHLLTAIGRNFQIASSATNGKRPSIFLTRAAFTDFDNRLLVDILINHLKLAIARYQAWHAQLPLMLGGPTPKMEQFLKRLRRNKLVKDELAKLSAYDLKESNKYAIHPEMGAEIERQLNDAMKQMPDFTPAHTIYGHALRFTQAVKEYDFNSAIRWWGLLTYELKELLIQYKESPGTPLAKDASKFLLLKGVQIFQHFAKGVSQVFHQYIQEHGIINQEGEEYGQVVGRLRIVDDVNKIGEMFAEEAKNKSGPVIWVLPYLPNRYDEIPGEGFIVGGMVNRHAADTAKEQSKPFAVVPNAPELLKPEAGEENIQWMMRVDEDGTLRLRKAYRGETGMPRAKVPIKIKVPKARVDGPLFYRLSTIDENFVSFVGPKAASIGKIMSAGINVPPGVVLSFAFWNRFEKFNRFDSKIPAEWQKIKVQDGKITTPDAELEQILSGIKKIILDSAFPDDLSKELEREINALRQESGMAAVDLDLLKSYIKQVFASKYNEQPVRLRLRNGIADDDVKPSVLIQVPKKARFAGTMYTADVVSRDQNWISIMASHGQGAAVVGENGYPAQIRIDKITGEIDVRHRESLIDQKYEIKYSNFFYVRSTFNFEDLTEFRTAGFYDSYPGKPAEGDTSSPIQVVEVSLSDRKVDILTLNLAKRLRDNGKRIEALYDSRPQDIEWAFDEQGTLWFVQSRPMKLEKLPTEKVMDEEILDRLALIDVNVLRDLKEALNKKDLERLIQGLRLDKGFQDMIPNPQWHAERIVAANYLSLIADHRETASKLSESQIKSIIQNLESGMNIVDPTVTPALLSFLRKVSVSKVDRGIRQAIENFFLNSPATQKKGLSHTVDFEIAKAAAIYGAYESAVKKLRDSGDTMNYPDIAYRTIQILGTIPLKYSENLLRGYATENPRVSLAINQFALRTIDKLRSGRAELRFASEGILNEQLRPNRTALPQNASTPVVDSVEDFLKNFFLRNPLPQPLVRTISVQLRENPSAVLEEISLTAQELIEDPEVVLSLPQAHAIANTAFTAKVDPALLTRIFLALDKSFQDRFHADISTKTAGKIGFAIGEPLLKAYLDQGKEIRKVLETTLGGDGKLLISANQVSDSHESTMKQLGVLSQELFGQNRLIHHLHGEKIAVSELEEKLDLPTVVTVMEQGDGNLVVSKAGDKKQPLAFVIEWQALNILRLSEILSILRQIGEAPAELREFYRQELGLVAGQDGVTRVGQNFLKSIEHLAQTTRAVASAA